MNWPAMFLKNAKKSKFNFVVAIVSLQVEVGLRVDGNRGYHWIVVIGNVEKCTSWVYDPANSSSATAMYKREVGILNKLMRAIRGSESYCFNVQRCSFNFQCQNVKTDGEHCGLWCVFYTMNWCLGTLSEYERVCEKASHDHGGIAKFGLKLKKRLYSDMVRHHYLLDRSFVDVWRSPVMNHSPKINDFWTITPCHILDHCRMRYASMFTEIDRHFEARVIDGPPPFPPRRAMFISSGNLVIKVYRFLWGKVSDAELAEALHETAATAYVCQRRKNWYFEAFGVVTTGIRASYVHICLCRNMLHPSNFSAPSVSNPFVILFENTGVVHGDGHAGNVMIKRFCKNEASAECIDFERSFLPSSRIDSSAVLQSIHSYYDACSELQRSIILRDQIRQQGLDRTRQNFLRFTHECLRQTETQDLFQFGIAHFVSIFERRG
jgi:hypothetical protein